MGYELHITRQKDLFDEDDARRISIDEWKEYVDADPDMRLDNYSEIITADKVLRLESDGLSVWTKYSGDGIEGGHAWFGYYEGSIAVKNPDDEIIGKMLEIAESLRASVFGDDGEIYGRSKEGKISFRHDNDAAVERSEDKKPWWKFWLL